MSDIEVDQENSTFDEYLHSPDEQKEKDLTPEKDQFSSDTDSDFCEPQKNEIYLPKTKEEKQKQNEEIVISSCSNLPNFNSTDARETRVENHYFIDASSLLDESEVTFTSVTRNEKPKSKHSEEFTTEFQKEIKITNLNLGKPEPSTSYYNEKYSTIEQFRDINTELPSSTSFKTPKSPEKSFDLPSSSSDRSYISLNSTLLECQNLDHNYQDEHSEKSCVPLNFTLNKNTDPLGAEKSYISLNSTNESGFQEEFHCEKDFEMELKKESVEIEPKVTWAEKNYSSLDSHYLNSTLTKTLVEINANGPSTSSDPFSSLDSHLLNKKIHSTPSVAQKVSIEDKKTSFVRSGTFDLDNEVIRKNEKRQGTLIFQNSIHQYSGHNLEPTTILPTTPFNSIIHIDKKIEAIEIEKIPKSDTVDSLSSLCEAQIKREDSVPIISGGILPSDCDLGQKVEEQVETKSTPKAAWVVDMSTPPPQKKVFSPPEDTRDLKLSQSQKSSLGFFIDLTEVPTPKVEEKKITKPESDEKKNIFSMSIEFQAPKRGLPQRLSQSLSTKKPPSELKNESKADKKVTERKKTVEVNGDSNGTQNGTKIQFRHKKSNSISNSTHNRHSWNGQNDDYNISNHQRTFSLSEKMSEHTSLTIDFKNDVIHLEQVETCENFIENQKEELPNIKSHSAHPKSEKSAQKVNGVNSETHLKNGTHSDDNVSSTTDKNGYRNCASVNTQLKNGVPSKNGESEVSQSVSSAPQSAKGGNQTVIIINHDDIDEYEEEKAQLKSDAFVSLSDLDKPLPKIITEEPVYTRMTRSIPETSWIENKLLMSRSIGCRPTTKLLSNMSTSTPSFCFSNANRISSESDVLSELSDFSSIQSSTALEISTEDTSQSLSTHHHSNKLGTDLLRMFLEEISPDLTITVAGRRLRAHKCILSSRCQYFAAMLSGGHVESTGNVISLDGFTFQAVYFAMCHIYSGAADIPESIDLVELATLADMLGLEGLKEVVATTLKLKYCHMFHKPCSVCVVGILETLQLAFTYSLDDLYRKCLKWITRYFVRVWATRAFASLTHELHEKCYQQHIVHMTADSVLETMLCVDKLLATLPNVRWAEIVTELSERLKDDSEVYLMDHFAFVLGSASFLSLGKELNWNISKLEGSFVLAAQNLSPEQACRSYTKINKLQPFLQTGDESWSMNFTELINNLYTRIESSVVRQAVRIINTNAWVKLDPYLKTRIQELACIPFDIPEPPPKTKHQPRSTSGSRNLDLRQIRLAMQQHTKRATSTESRVKKVQQQKKEVVKVVPQEVQPPRPRTWPAQTLKPKIISSSDSSRNSSPAMKNAKNVQKTPEKKPIPPKATKADKKVAPKSKVTPPVKQHMTNSQKTIKLTSSVTKSAPKVQKTTATKPASSSNVSKSGSNSSNQQSPSLINRNKVLSSSNSTPSQPKSDSPSLRKSLLLAAKAPQVPVKPMSPATNKRLARIQASNSLTSPTKASMAKCVNNVKVKNQSKPTKEKTEKIVKTESKKSDKPTVERSGTFLKDEPTVLTKI